MLRTLSTLVLFLVLASQVMAFEILAIGTSNTNCKNVDRSRMFTAHLEQLLQQENVDVQVINAGVNGDTPMWMSRRLTTLVNPNTKLEILEPGPNDRYKERSIEYTDQMVNWLKEQKLPIIYVSNSVIQKGAEAKEYSEQRGMYYYGGFASNIPRTTEFRQFDDSDGFGGHLTALGCELWAKNMLPLVKNVLQERNIK